MDAGDRFERYLGDGTVADGARGGTAQERGTYLASAEVANAVNTALAAQQPLLVTGEPGVGKTTLAQSIARELGLGEVLEFHTRSDHQARDCLYAFDSMRRFYDAQVKHEDAKEPGKYIRWEALGDAIRGGAERVVLIDEVDKAPRDFPNDLLHVIDRMEFTVAETGERFASKARPVVLITSNSERQLPDPFLRRCVYCHIEFPSKDMLAKILAERLPASDLVTPLAQAAVDRLLALRERFGAELEHKPSTGELIAWMRVLLKARRSPEELAGASRLADLPHLGALLKTAHDRELVAAS